MAKRIDYRSGEAAEYRKLYRTSAWQKRRMEQLTRDPMCRYCEAIGLSTSAKITDHIVPHKGDTDLFFFGELQSLCKQCHDSAKAREENGGWTGLSDADGYPVDPRHPANQPPKFFRPPPIRGRSL